MAASFADRHARSFSSFTARKGNGLLGAWHRRGADAGSGSRRLADRQLLMAMGLLREYSGWNCFHHHDENVHLRSAIYSSWGGKSGYVGHRNARSRDWRIADRARQGPARRLVFIELDR